MSPSAPATRAGLTISRTQTITPDGQAARHDHYGEICPIDLSHRLGDTADIAVADDHLTIYVAETSAADGAEFNHAATALALFCGHTDIICGTAIIAGPLTEHGTAAGLPARVSAEIEPLLTTTEGAHS